MNTVLIVDDEAGVRESVRAILGSTFRVLEAASAAEALGSVRRDSVDAVLMDISMPGLGGLEALEAIREIRPGTPVVMLTADSTDESVIAAVRGGARDYITKPFRAGALLAAVSAAIGRGPMARRAEALEADAAREYPVHGIIAVCPEMRQALADAAALAAVDGPAMVRGERGSGRGLLARIVHASGPRAQEPFSVARPGPDPGAAAEAIFGRARLPGSDRIWPGALDLAGPGTAFVSDAECLPGPVLARLAAAFRDGAYRRDGGGAEVPLRCRLLLGSAAPPGPLAPEMEDLVAGRVIWIPPLRERAEDIPLLAHYFLARLRRGHEALADFEPEVIDMFRSYGWPGNLREMRNLVERMLVVHGHRPVADPACLPREIRSPGVDPDVPDRWDETLESGVSRTERAMIAHAIRQAGGVKSRAARLLGTTRRILEYRMRRLGMGQEDGSPDQGDPE